jgi:hypothetical protein
MKIKDVPPPSIADCAHTSTLVYNALLYACVKSEEAAEHN